MVLVDRFVIIVIILPLPMSYYLANIKTYCALLLVINKQHLLLRKILIEIFFLVSSFSCRKLNVGYPGW